jgi:hypothetical protein
MAYTHTYTLTGAGGRTVRATPSISVDADDYRQISVPPSTSNHYVDVDFLHTALKTWFAVPSGIADDLDVTIKTNSSGAPDDTITIRTPGASLYMDDYVGTNPFSAAVTALYVTNPSTTATLTLDILYGHDSTP